MTQCWVQFSRPCYPMGVKGGFARGAGGGSPSPGSSFLLYFRTLKGDTPLGFYPNLRFTDYPNVPTGRDLKGCLISNPLSFAAKIHQGHGLLKPYTH